MPILTLVAGPNGSGKSTLTAALRFEGSDVIDPDAIAKRIDPENPARAGIAAGRQAIVHCRSLIARRESFVLESTLAGHGAFSVVGGAKAAGYHVHLIYTALRDVELHVDRVCLRVAQGGHDVPEDALRRRYGRSLLNAPQAMRLADETHVFDNSGIQMEPMLRLNQGRIVWSAASPPAWVQVLKAKLE